jgi:hypothetical protein
MAASRRAKAGLVLCALALGALACGGDEKKAAAVSAPPPINGHIDPAPYKTEIQATEALLYATSPLGDDGWKDLSKALLELHNAIVFHDNSELARETSRRLFFLSARVDAEPNARHNGPELVLVRNDWEKIRSEQFASADWFRAATP